MHWQVPDREALYMSLLACAAICFMCLAMISRRSEPWSLWCGA